MTPGVAGRDDLRTSRPAQQPANPPSSWPAPPYAAVAAAAEDQCMGSPVHSRTGDRPCTAPRSDLTPTRPETGTRRRLALVGPNSCIARGRAERQSSPHRTRLPDLSSTDHAGGQGLLPQSREAGESGRGPGGGCAVQRSRSPVRPGLVSELEASADMHHRRAPRGRGGHRVAAAVRRQRRVVGWWLSTGG